MTQRLGKQKDLWTGYGTILQSYIHKTPMQYNFTHGWWICIQEHPGAWQSIQNSVYSLYNWMFNVSKPQWLSFYWSRGQSRPPIFLKISVDFCKFHFKGAMSAFKLYHTPRSTLKYQHLLLPWALYSQNRAKFEYSYGKMVTNGSELGFSQCS